MKGVKIGWRRYLGNDSMEAETQALFESAVPSLADQGAELVDHVMDFEPTLQHWAPLTFSLWNARFSHLAEELGEKMTETLRFWMKEGNGVTGVEVQRANEARTRLFRLVESWFTDIDLLVTPTLTRAAIAADHDPREPITLDEKTADVPRASWYPYTHPFNLTGHPAITVPCGFTSEGLPVGLQIVGQWLSDEKVLHAAAVLSAPDPGPRDVRRFELMSIGNRIQTFEDVRQLARGYLPWMVFDYIDGAAGEGVGERVNRETIRALRLQPRVLNNVENRDLKVSIFGQEVGMPFGICPMGMCNLSRPGADVMLARLSAKQGIPHGVSTAASTSLERMNELAEGNAWFQLYFSGNQEASLALVERAIAADYKTLILTVDVPEVGHRPRELRRGFRAPFKIGPSQFLDFTLHPRWSLGTLFNGAPELANFSGDQATLIATRAALVPIGAY